MVSEVITEERPVTHPKKRSGGFSVLPNYKVAFGNLPYGVAISTSCGLAPDQQIQEAVTNHLLQPVATDEDINLSLIEAIATGRIHTPHTWEIGLSEEMGPWLQLTALTVPGPANRRGFLQIVTHDITSIVLREKALGEALKKERERSKENAAIIVHDLRNPLGASSGFLDLTAKFLQTNNPDLTKVAEFVTKANEANRRINQRIQNIMDWSHLPEDSKKEPVSIQNIIQQAIELNTQVFEQEGVELECQLPDKNIRILADIAHLSAVFSILFTNGIHSITDRLNRRHAIEELAEYPGKVTVTYLIEDNKIFLFVRDNGQGVPKKIREKIFTGHSTKRASMKGSGSGLPEARKIAIEHGGALWLSESITEDELWKSGQYDQQTRSTFTIALPLFSIQL